MAFINKLAKALGVEDDGDLGYYGEWMMSREEAQARYDERLEDMVIDKIEKIIKFYNKPYTNGAKTVSIGYRDYGAEYVEIKFLKIIKENMAQTFKVGEMIKLDFYQESQVKQVLVIDEDDDYYYCKEV